MEFIGFAHSYKSYGGSRIYSPVADLLLLRMKDDYGAAVQSIYFTVHLKSESHKAPSNVAGFPEFFRNLDKLPKVTFRRRLNRIELQYLSQQFVAEDDRTRKSLPADKCNTACKEVAEALTLISNRI